MTADPPAEQRAEFAPPRRSADGAGNGRPLPAAIAFTPVVAAIAGLPPVAPDVDERERPRTFESLSIPGFRRFFLSALAVVGAMMMQGLARGYVVFSLTGSYAALGGVALAQALPGLLFTLPGGVMADRLSRRPLVLIGLSTHATNAVTIALLIFSGHLAFWHLVVSAAVQGSVFSITTPAWQTVVPEVVGLRRLMNATALSMGGNNIIQLAAPAAGGLIIAVAGAGWVFVAVGVQFLASAAFFARVPLLGARERAALHAALPGAALGGPSRRRLGDVSDGLRYAWREPTIRVLLLGNIVVTFFAMPFQMLLPGFVADQLHGGAGLLGALQSTAAIGAFCGTLVIASLPNRRRGRVLLLGGVVMGAALIGFSLARLIWLTVITMIVLGAGMTVWQSLNNVLVQVNVDDRFRGRVTSLSMMQMNLAMLGAFGAGVLATSVGARHAFTVLGLIVIALVATFATLVPRLRRLD